MWCVKLILLGFFGLNIFQFIIVCFMFFYLFVQCLWFFQCHHYKFWK